MQLNIIFRLFAGFTLKKKLLKCLYNLNNFKETLSTQWIKYEIKLKKKAKIAFSCKTSPNIFCFIYNFNFIKAKNIYIC